MSNQAACGVEGCNSAARFQFASATVPMDYRCPRHALLYSPVLGRAARVALVVGTILFAINQSDVVLAGQVSAVVAAKIGLTYLVPFSVSTYSALAANRLRSG
jgi:hypothetical protein